MPKPYFDLERIDPDALRRVGGILKGLGYTEAGVRDRLGLDDLADLSLPTYPYHLNYRLRRRGPLDLAIILFLLQGVITQEELASLFDPQARRLLRVANLLAGDRASRTYRARVSLYPLAEKLFVTDHRFGHLPWIRARVPREPVMHLDSATYRLARTTLQRPLRSTLDLGAGAGVHAILASAHVERAVGVDFNPRAVNFARLNAMLNDAWNTVFLEGDLFSPVSGERFDQIVAHPPFVPAPVYELGYRDGGPSGADVLRRIVAALPDFLASGGVAQVVTHLAEREGESYLERTRRWLGGANMHLHSLRLAEHDVVDYAVRHVRRTFDERYPRYADKLVQWVTNLRSQRFERVVEVVLTFQWNDEAPHPPWTQEDEAKPPRAPMHHELGRLLDAKRRVRKLPDLASLDPLVIRAPKDLLLIERRRPCADGFETQDFRVTFRDANLSPELEIKPLVRDLLERVDGQSTVPQVIARLAADTGQPAQELDERCRRAVLVMFERGLIELDDPDTSSPRPPAPDPLAISEEPEAPPPHFDDPPSA